MRTWIRVLRAAWAAVTLAAVMTQLVFGLARPTFSVTNFLSFFTIQSNLLAALALLVLAVRGTDGVAAMWLRGLATLCMVTTGIVYVLLLSGLEEQLQTPIPWVNTVLHYAGPVLLLLDWFGDRSGPDLGVRRALLWLLFPLAWLGYSLVRGPIVDWYPYPFLDPRPGGYGPVLVACLGIAVVVSGLALLLARFPRRRPRGADEPAVAGHR